MRSSMWIIVRSSLSQAGSLIRRKPRRNRDHSPAREDPRSAPVPRRDVRILAARWRRTPDPRAQFARTDVEFGQLGLVVPGMQEKAGDVPRYAREFLFQL
jgi:hypothetical protein